MGSDRIAKTSMPISYYKRYAQRNYGKTTAEQHAFYFFRHLTSNYSPKDTLNSGGGVHIVMYGRSGMTIDPRIPYNARTQHVGFSPTRQTLLAQSAKRRGVCVGGVLIIMHGRSRMGAVLICCLS